ncbi:DUF1656 domain-containing protein [Acidocella sp.]|uniref:DUF1656 domain-containing protein n=1 Tax=Acidocella sp. TaxID=50710 RepID=UPI002629FA5F|nr:DUF1656 domain-containing protein [Acidocella sp.]
MIGEVNLFGVLLPPLLVWAGLALLLSAGLRRVFARAGLYRYIWHRPLFDFSLLIILTGLVSLVMTRLF